MKKKITIAVAFFALLVGGTMSASAIAGKSPLSVLQTVSTTTTTASTSTTTGSTTTGTTGTTTTSSTTGTATTTATVSAHRKVTICHHVFKSKSTRHVTLRINRSSWSAHQKHGDSIGACTTATAKKAHSTKAHVKRWHHGKGK